MEFKIIIPYVLPGLNDYSDMERKHPQEAARMKRITEERLMWTMKQQLRSVRLRPPVRMAYLWVERDRRRDKDNIAFAKKFIQDAIVKLGVLHDDGWDYIEGFADGFAVDKAAPRIEITIYDGEDI